MSSNIKSTNTLFTLTLTMIPPYSMPEGGKTGGTPAPGGSKEDPKQSGHKDDKPKEGGKRSYLYWGVGRRDRSHDRIWLLWGKEYVLNMVALGKSSSDMVAFGNTFIGSQ